MTAIELFNQITSEPKWYAGYTSPQHANLLKKRFHAKTLEFGTLEKLFNHFGYILDAEWRPKPSCHICQKPLDIKVKADIYYCELHGPGI